METRSTPTPAFDMVLFGGAGDLVMRKLLPSLYQAHNAACSTNRAASWRWAART
ncbi:glucose-6-phosphate 1-dehydrogenase [Chromobacterium violaceum]|uniref:Glucose-6-phosphate 1-dehydrogenase n=1 Tax=Chromobacterium violaceum TaxID=536 RepID=A0A447T4J9_CHRVL|nr:glucose-6-phosphate 1-dehydrogenase [Chromobacterium violaceum]